MSALSNSVAQRHDMWLQVVCIQIHPFAHLYVLLSDSFSCLLLCLLLSFRERPGTALRNSFPGGVLTCSLLKNSRWTLKNLIHCWLLGMEQLGAFPWNSLPPIAFGVQSSSHLAPFPMSKEGKAWPAWFQHVWMLLAFSFVPSAKKHELRHYETAKKYLLIQISHFKSSLIKWRHASALDPDRRPFSSSQFMVWSNIKT